MDHETYLNWKRWNTEKFAAVRPGSTFYFDQIFRGVVRKKSRILEIGFGNGGLLGHFRTHGHDVVGVEINDRLVARAKESGYPAYLGAVWNIIELQSSRFDLIVAFDVVEHMGYEELNAFFSWVRSHLSDGGKLYLRFPEGASPFGLANQNGDFTHVTSLTMPKIEFRRCPERS